ncbi:MAG TPA: DUF1365 domain-containing protein [Micromonosporaceae bacterium]
MIPCIYEAQIRHVRLDPIRNAFRYRSYYWLVDIDELPRQRWPLLALAGFDARDHFDDPEVPIRDNLDRLLASHDIELGGGRVLMLAHARVLGYVFNPLSVFWCHDATGRLVAVVAEVHNTYGGRHSYVLPATEDGVLHVAKEFYVSPFYDVDGAYRMRLPVPDDRLALTVALHHDGARPFVATLRGSRRPATASGLIGAALHHPASTLVGALLIRFQGIRLYLRGLPVVPRPSVKETVS